MAYTLSTRSLTQREQNQLRAWSRLSLDDWTWVLAPGPSFAFGGYMLGVAVEWLFSFAALDTGSYARIGLAIVGSCLGLFASAHVYGDLRGAAKSANLDLTNDYVQVIHVKDTSVVQQTENYSEGPILYFNLDAETILFLWGQWLFDPHVYNAGNNLIAADAETFLNTQNRRFAFPCTEFTIHRSPTLGRVLSIETNGEPLAPVKTLACRDIPLQDLAESEMLYGAFDDLSGAMSRCKRVVPFDNAT